MTKEKVLEVIKCYRSFFELRKIPQLKMTSCNVHDVTDDFLRMRLSHSESLLAHCHAMLDQVEQFAKEGCDGKMFRWFGFIQGVLWATGDFTLSQLKNHDQSDNDNPAV